MVGARPKLETLYDVFVNVRSKSAVTSRGLVVSCRVVYLLRGLRERAQ